MLGNYIKIALRNILNQRFFSFLNILGLAWGIATFLFIFIYIQSEKFYDRDWDDHESIYRINQHIDFGKGTDYFAFSSYPLANVLDSIFPQVKNTVRTTQYFRRPVKVDTTFFDVERMIFADKDFFEVFNFKFAEGMPTQALNRENSIVISKNLAHKLFPKEEAIGKIINFGGSEFMVRGVFYPQHKKTHIQPECVISMEHIYQKHTKEWDDAWMKLWVYTYMKLKARDQFNDFSTQFNAWQDTAMTTWQQKVKLDYKISFLPQPVSEIHLDDLHEYALSSATDPYYLNILNYVALLVLIIASVNFVNLGTARSVKRAKEVGIRKVAGATRKQLILQFLSESIIITFVSSVIALVLVEFSLPLLNRLLDTDLSLFHFFFHEERLNFARMFILLNLSVGTLSGLFPAFILSTFEPINVLKIGGLQSRTFFRKNTVSVTVRKVLVISQFVVATALIIITVTIYDQIIYLKTTDMGFDKGNVLVIDLPKDRGIEQKKIDSLVTDLENLETIERVESGLGLPGYKHGRISFYIDRGDSTQQILMNFNFVDFSYTEMLKLRLTEGRFFNPDSTSDPHSAFVVNEAARKALGDSLLGLKMACGLGIEGRIVGVLNNFNYKTLQDDIEPMVLVHSSQKRHNLAVKIKDCNYHQAIEESSRIWQNHFPEHLMHYEFLEENFYKQYRKEEKLFTLFVFTASMAIFIALLGLFGLSTFIIEQQAKSIGIKKVLGASVRRLVFISVKRFAYWVVIASILAWPIAFFTVRNWLNNFAFHVEVNPLIFLCVSFSVLLFASLTVSYQAYVAAVRSPIDALKYE